MEHNNRTEKDHGLTVAIFGLILKGFISFYLIITFFGNPNVESFLSNSSKLVSIYYYAFGALLLVIVPFILALFLCKRWFYKASKVLAVIVCFGFPLGTAVGIFTIILLRRESIKLEFGISKPLGLRNEKENKTKPRIGRNMGIV